MQASPELDDLAELAEPAMHKALQGTIGLESRRRIEHLLQTLATKVPPPDRLRPCHPMSWPSVKE